MSDTIKTLYYLDELPDYKVASDYLDVMGWDVNDANNRTLGKVTGLVVNKEAERVVYLDVEVDKSLIQVGYDSYQVPASEGVHGFINKDGDDHLILPIGMVNLDVDQERVHTNKIDYATFAQAKRFNRVMNIDRDYELALFRHYNRNDVIDEANTQSGFYDRREFDNNLRRKDS